jgi:hypothetical protein
MSEIEQRKQIYEWALKTLDEVGVAPTDSELMTRFTVIAEIGLSQDSNLEARITTTIPDNDGNAETLITILHAEAVTACYYLKAATGPKIEKSHQIAEAFITDYKVGIDKNRLPYTRNSQGTLVSLTTPAAPTNDRENTLNTKQVHQILFYQ